MIYVSSICMKAYTIKESVMTLADAGFRNIELSGGTKYYPAYETELLELQEEYDLNYLVHNYFPPPPNPFVLNLASLNDQIYDQSIEHCNLAIELSKRLGGTKYGVHAGFLIDIRLNDIGKSIAYESLFDRKTALARFKNAWDILLQAAAGELALYIENNVISSTNAKTYNGNNPFLFTDYDGYLELSSLMQFRPLLDLAHLKVSANSLGMDYNHQVDELTPLTDYIHVSNNDGLHDQHKGLTAGSDILDVIEGYDFKTQTITLEVYDEIEGLKSCYDILERSQRSQL